MTITANFAPQLLVVVLLDDILIHSKNMKEHVEDMRKVFEILRENKLREAIKERLRPKEGAVSRAHVECGGRIRGPTENRSLQEVESTGEHKGVAAFPRLRQLLQQVRAAVR
ncbi:unnamed protein product [Closterium sp. NIES-53]